MSALTTSLRGLSVSLGLWVSAAASAAVTNDTTFGNFNGTATISQGGMISEHVRDLDVDAEGRIVLAGHVDLPPASGNGNNFALAMARLTANGLPDPTFSGDGKLYLSTCAARSSGPGGTQNPKIVHQADGRILVGATCAGAQYEQIVLVRFLEDGTLDDSFDGDGILYAGNPATDLGSDFNDLAIQADGKILVAGMVGTQVGIVRRGVVLRFNTDGTTDTSFATQGAYRTAESGVFTAIALTADGGVVVAGNTAATQAGTTDLLVTRLTASGSPDPAFGTGGVVVRNVGVLSAPVDPDFPTMDTLRTLAVRPDGRILVGGYARDSRGQPQYEPLLLQLTSRGALDTGWGEDGYVNLGGVPGDFNVLAIHLLANGEALVGGIRIPFTHLGSNGLGQSSDSVPRNTYGIALQDGRAVIATATANPSLEFRAMRFDFTAQFDATPDSFGFGNDFVVPLGVPRQSQTVTITGIATSTDVSVVNGEFSIACTGTFVHAGETRLIQTGTALCLRHTTSENSNTVTTTTLTVGGVSADWSTTTGDGSPDNLVFASQPNVARSTVVTSAAVTVTGINIPVRLMISGGEHSIGCSGTYSSNDATITNNQTLCLRHTSAAAASAVTTTNVRIGDVATTFTSTTAASPPGDGGGGDSSGGGGGGSLDWWLLLSLALAVASGCARRMRHQRISVAG